MKNILINLSVNFCLILIAEAMIHCRSHPIASLVVGMLAVAWISAYAFANGEDI